MTTSIEKYKHELPSVAELYDDKDLTLKNTALATLLNTEPKQEWVKYNSIAKCKYIPIETVEFLLTRVFGKWRVEVKESKIVANSILVTIRLHFIDPVTGDWDWQDGLGAAPLQTDAGAGATEFDKIKNASVMMAAPSAESFAVKDAAEKLGKIFGKDLNRKDAQAYDQLVDQKVKLFTPVEERLKAMIEDAATPEDLNNIRTQVTPQLMDLFTQKEAEING